ncbi:MAG: 2-succinyl-5-enolpyruvyl-6-hydroxy-3-cyclohexene-1-carboxylate synthase, partial [Flavobacteriaceae bacterium]|nr:2-succinyl-5-enolpyruvyl-6-hydroxy-3-cyclohexene-1-carboxylate synthase [Flavobacteriaceae bacterium]
YHCLSHHFSISPQLFFSQFFFLTEKKESNFQKTWLKVKESRQLNHKKILKQVEFSDLKVFEIINQSLPNDIQLQLSNSSIIRYSQLFDLNKTIQVFCNRGASGIDGSTSTAIGAASVQNKQTVFITGDISFFYDSNALWNKYIKSDFRIILINNSGGGIFRFIPGPQTTNALDYFETPHNYNASYLCKMYDIDYYSAENEDELKGRLKTFYQRSDFPKLLEIFTPSMENDRILKNYFLNIK